MPRELSPNCRNVVVVGGSAGALDAIRTIVGGLRRDLPAAVFVVQHIGGHRSAGVHLPQLVGAGATLPVQPAVDAARICDGEVRTCVPDRHLVLERDRAHLVRGPRENHCRPSIDPLFRSAAAHHPGRVIAVLLSGYLSDGVAGLGAVRRCGGLTIVQDPDDAKVREMPANALGHHDPDYVGSAERIADLLNQLAGQPAPERSPVPEDIMLEASMASGRHLAIESENRLGRPSPYSCPECSGNLWEVDDAIRRYRCHVGHAFTADTLGELQATKLDEALWSALRAMRERARLLRQLADDASTSGRQASQASFGSSAREIEEQAGTLEAYILDRSRADVA